MKSRIIELNKKTRTYSVAKTSALVPDGINVLEEITAEDGMFLTQAADVDIIERVVGRQVMLGHGHTSSEWREITEAEKEKIEAEQAKIFEAQLNELDDSL